MENVRKHRDIKIFTIEKRRNYLVSELNYHTTKFFTEHLLVIKMKNNNNNINNKNATEVHTNKPVYLGLSILELSKA